MRNIAFLLLLPLVLFSCNNEETEDNTEKPEDNFTISGKITDAANTTLYLEALSQQGAISVAQGTVNTDGTFKMTGNIPGMGIYQLRLGEASDKVIPLTLVPKDHVKINTSFSNFQTNPNVSGTEWSAVMNKYMDEFNKFAQQQQALNAKRDQLSEDQMMEQFVASKKPLDDFAREQMNNDPDNPFNIVLSSSAMPNTGFKDWDPENLTVLKKVSEAYNKKYKDSPFAATMENQVMQIESAYNEFLNSPESTGVAPEIALKNPDGKIMKLSSLRGKIVLIDFWASWCGPCRKENPNVVKLYNEYKNKGFAIFSVSLDQDANAWKQAIKQDGLIWPHHVSDLMGWNTSMTQVYGFNSIPHTVLIDREGKIIATGLRGESLEQKLKELLSKK